MGYAVEVVHYPRDEDTYFVMIMSEGRPVSDDYIFEVNDPADLYKAFCHATMVVDQLQAQEARSVASSPC
jgi:hypothetical protein